MRTGLLLHTSIFCSLTLAAVGCGGGSSKPPAAAPTMKVVGTSGGALSSSDGNLAVNIPPGALPGNVTITTEPAAAPADGSVGTVYEIGPTGTQFAMPVTLTLHYEMSALGGAAESSLRVATFAGGSWQLLPGAAVNKQAKTVSGVTTHLSPYAIVTEAAGKTCATVQTAYGCAPNAGSTSGGTPAGASNTCAPPTCADATNLCGQYPGATMDSCVDSSTGYSAACCFAANAPICFAIGGSDAPCAGTSGGGGSCPPPPTCGSTSAAAACGGYPGATLQNCTDGAHGFTGACCFAPEAPVCVKTGAGRACAGSTNGGGTTCPPPPRCNDGNPCAGYVGATASSCTDTADGFEATCCFAAGTLPIASGGGSTNPGGDDGGVPKADGGTSGTGGMTGGGTCTAGATCTAGYRCGNASPTGQCLDCSCGADGTLVCVPCGDKPDGGPGASTGTTGAGGITGGGTCAPGATCTAGNRCGDASPNGQCLDCSCGADGTLACVPCGGKLDGGAGASTGTTGAGGMTGGGACTAGATCTAGYRCGDASPDGQCLDCSCGADGTLVCVPCGDKVDGGAGASTGTTGAGGMTGGGTCLVGATCTAGYRCGAPSPTGQCQDCSCGADGTLACVPCGDKPDAGGTGGGACLVGATCTAGYRCGAPSPTGQCQDCSCGADGTLACVPCGDKPDAGGTGGTATGPCQVMPMPSPDVGLPCGVMESCPDGSNYRVRCDGVTGACTCIANGVPTATMPTASCSAFNPSAELLACGFPDGKI
jgi:hypothetical protein